LAMWLGSALIEVVAIVAAASGWERHPSTCGKSETLSCRICHFLVHFLSAGGEVSPINVPTIEPEEEDNAQKEEHKLSAPMNRLRDRLHESLKRFATFFPGLAISPCIRMALLRNVLLSKPSTPIGFKKCVGKVNKLPGTIVEDIATPVGPAGTSNPRFFEWSGGMSFKVEVNEIEELSPQRQPVGSVVLAKGIGLQVVNAGARGSDVSLVIAPCGVDGDLPHACLLKGVKGRRTSQVTETEHLWVNTFTGTKERRSNQGGAGLWFHSKCNGGDVVASQNPLEGVILKATSLPIHRLSAIFPKVLRFGILKPDTLQAPEEVRLYCYYENRPLRILQVLMQLVPCAEVDAESS